MNLNTTPIPAIIVCGFLGAGKTTLVRRLLADADGVRYGVLLNDFGAVDIEGALLAEAGADRVVLNNGCICCAVTDDLTDALDRLLASDPAPQRIVIEASGVSRPLPVADALATDRFRGRVRLDGVFCLVDAAGFADLDFAATELAIDQAVGSDLVVFNKADLAGAARLAAVERVFRAAMPRLRGLATERAALPRALLFAEGVDGAGERVSGRQSHHHAHHHAHEEDWEIWSWSSAGRVDPARLRRALRSLPAGVLRAKGTVADAAGDHFAFHVVGKRADIAAAPGGATACAAVAIGRHGAFAPAALTALFEGCLVGAA